MRTAALTHPLAWWAWAAGVTVAVVRLPAGAATVLILLAVLLVGVACRADSPWAKAFPAAIALGVIIVAVRVGFHLVVGLPDSSPVLWVWPQIELPGWFTNLSLLGPVHADGLTSAALTGLSLATLVITFGAVNAIANPRLALRCLPGSLHHLGTAAVIAVSVTPQLITAIARVRRAQGLRGTPRRGLRAFSARLIPVLAGALDQALELAASMDSRGYGRVHPGRGGRRGVTVGVTIALVAAVAGTYALLDASAPRGLGLAVLIGGAAVAAAASVFASRAVVRTRYRPLPWGLRAWLVAGTGAVALVIALAGRAAGTDAMLLGVLTAAALAAPTLSEAT
ncbi:energy-coupling factor transporter transmembrane protein EcfT [Ruania suaedae]|uniref:CbiQ family ECF transporter T component n=1 Tax=Ruania suaedae TaxID=2897774 RepID=UPI001E4E58C7|nr:CbiQ family ECF transporter T component [Ruania suaedae]UFU02082.1 energy-coupling factor transporter transmembrane protein EcfT [Ruania suaedae]